MPAVVKQVQLGTILYSLPFVDEIPMDDDDIAALRESIRKKGRVREPVLCWQEHKANGRETIVDGAHRVTLAAELGLEAVPRRYQSFDSEEAAREECKDLNENRRQLSEEQKRVRRGSRIERVAAARAEGQSTRTIAAAEGVSQSQVQRDLEAAEHGQNGQQEGIQIEPPGSISPPEVTRQGGGTYPAKRKLLCDKCKRLGIQAVDCAGCKLVRDAAAKKKKAAAAKKKAAKKQPAEVKDQTGAVVPDQCRDAFADPSLVDLVGELETVASMMTPESWITRAGKLCAHYPFILIEKAKEHAWEALHQLQIAVSDIKAGVAYAVCPACAGTKTAKTGNPCQRCRGCGHVPEWKWREMEADKAKS